MTTTFVRFSRTLVLSIGITALASSIASAQTLAQSGANAPAPSTAAPEFARALRGQEVWITADGARVRGRVISLTPSAVILVEDGVSTTIEYTKIVRVEESTHRIRKGTLIGLASGLGLGAMIGVYCWGNCEPGLILILTGYYAGIGAAAGVGIGAIINAAKKRGDVLYDARRSTTTISFAPILSSTRKGMAFSVTWR